MAKRFIKEAPISEVLGHIISQNKLGAGLERIDAKQAWLDVMGPGVNSYTEFVELKGDTLYVKLTSSVLRHELSYGTSKIIQMLNEEMRKEVIKKIFLK